MKDQSRWRRRNMVLIVVKMVNNINVLNNLYRCSVPFKAKHKTLTSKFCFKNVSKFAYVIWNLFKLTFTSIATFSVNINNDFLAKTRKKSMIIIWFSETISSFSDEMLKLYCRGCQTEVNNKTSACLFTSLYYHLFSRDFNFANLE